MLEGSRSRFVATVLDDDLIERAHRMDVHPTGPLWGKGESILPGQARQLENEVLGEFDDWCKGLESAGLDYDRRPLRVTVGNFVQELIGNDILKVTFSLPPGAYATMVLRELVRTSTERRLPLCRHQLDALSGTRPHPFVISTSDPIWI